MTAHFRDDHDRLRSITCEYLDFLDQDCPPDLAGVLKRRTAFATLFNAHFARENRAVDALRTGWPDSPVDRLLDQHRVRVRDVIMRHSGLIQRWPPKRIAEDWQAYRRDIQTQGEVYFAFLEWEEAVIHPLLVRHVEPVRRRAWEPCTSRAAPAA